MKMKFELTSGRYFYTQMDESFALITRRELWLHPPMGLQPPPDHQSIFIIGEDGEALGCEHIVFAHIVSWKMV
jgi:hypothetical protein